MILNEEYDFVRAYDIIRNESTGEIYLCRWSLKFILLVVD